MSWKISHQKTDLIICLLQSNQKLIELVLTLAIRCLEFICTILKSSYNFCNLWIRTRDQKCMPHNNTYTSKSQINSEPLKLQILSLFFLNRHLSHLSWAWIRREHSKPVKLIYRSWALGSWAHLIHLLQVDRSICAIRRGPKSILMRWKLRCANSSMVALSSLHNWLGFRKQMQMLKCQTRRSV